MLTNRCIKMVILKFAKRESERRLRALEKYKVAPLVNGNIPKGRNEVIC